jgi:predicted GIY-YIG superfamily endonuclease
MPGWVDKHPCVASQRDGVLYTGVTTYLFERVSEHKQDLFEGFTK